MQSFTGNSQNQEIQKNTDGNKMQVLHDLISE